VKATMLRTAAFGVAILAALDPSLTTDRRSRPLIAVQAGTRDGALANRVAAELERRFTVVYGLNESASATVLAGATAPVESRIARAPVFAVLPASRRPQFRITRIDVPSSVPLNARVNVQVQVPVVGAAGRMLDVQLSMDGLVIGQQNAPVRADSSIVVAEMSVAPGIGSHVLTATARLSGETALDSASVLVDVRDDRLPVLFFDARPSWTSTFVRRAVEQDARFVVAHRTLTSRGLSNTGGPAPLTLRDLESTKAFATIAVGAPDQLSEGDVAGLEAFMRRRGGRVVLLMEGRSSAALDRLSGAQGWRGVQLAAPTPITDDARVELLRGRELYWPATLPSGASVHAFSIARDSTRRPVVWSVPVGAGRMIISGAIDAWHYRGGGGGGGDSSGFNDFWSSTIASNALAAPASVDVQVTPSLAAPGDEAIVRVTVRDAFLSERDQRSSRMHATLISDHDSTPIRLWPGSSPGVLTGTLVAPRTTGTYQILVAAGAERASAALVVDSALNRPGRDEPDVVGAFVSSRNGIAIGEADLNRLPDLISSAIESVSRVETWHPMRSPWWIVPFALLLGAEWWWRRRNGLA
jgi:hypothetical protein